MKPSYKKSKKGDVIMEYGNGNGRKIVELLKMHKEGLTEKQLKDKLGLKDDIISIPNSNPMICGEDIKPDLEILQENQIIIDINRGKYNEIPLYRIK